MHYELCIVVIWLLWLLILLKKVKYWDLCLKTMFYNIKMIIFAVVFHGISL